MKFKEKIAKILIKTEKPILFLIVLNLCVFILDTVQIFHTKYIYHIKTFEMFSVTIFTIEYFLRCLTVKKVSEIFKPMMLIDLVAVLPYYLKFFTVNTLVLRIFRLSRLFRILKINRYSNAMNNIIKAFKEKKEELVITFSLFFCGILISSIFLFFAEHNAQPDMFSSIPKTFYFSIATFTSVGYGDVTAITPIGRMISSVSAILGVGLHGLFIGVIGTAFLSVFQKKVEL